jgi:predicted DNA helicase
MTESFIKRLDDLISALNFEKNHELNSYSDSIKNTQLEDRINNGITLYPIQFSDVSYTDFGDFLLKVEINPDQNIYGLRNGTIVELFDQEGNNLTGSIYKKRDNFIYIQNNNDNDYNWVSNGKVGINILPDTKTYELFSSRLQSIKEAKDYNYLNVIYENKPAFYSDIFNSSILNEFQNKAINNIIEEQNKISIIHGPPGTGKTKTLVESIKYLVAHNKRILICAPTNTAVDNISNQLILEEIDMCRIGNPSKIDDKIISNTLEFKAKADSSFKLIERLKKDASNIRKEAFKYKRQFGKEEFTKRKELKKELKEIRGHIKKIQKDIYGYIVNETQVISGTFAGILSESYLKANFDYVIIDEAAQAIEPAIWSVAHLGNKLVLAGDHQQLPPFVNSPDAIKLKLNQSMIETANLNSFPLNLLNIQYRMNQKIMGFSNQKFYDSKLFAAETIKDQKIDTDLFEPIEFVDTAGCDFEENKSTLNFGISNLNEVDLLIKRINEFELTYEQIGVISPYRNQVQEIQKKLIQPNIRIDTIDSFQGQERDIIVISMVRSNNNNEIGFLKDYRRMNVAMTRAQKKLIIIGDSSTIGTDHFFDDLLTYIENNGSYRSAWEYMN